MIDYEILQDIITDHELCKVQENELAKVVELLKADRLIELPCKVEDTVYAIEDNDICENKMTEIFFNTDGRYIFSKEVIGKSVFLTKEEAEAKLAELKGAEE